MVATPPVQGDRSPPRLLSHMMLINAGGQGLAQMFLLKLLFFVFAVGRNRLIGIYEPGSTPSSVTTWSIGMS